MDKELAESIGAAVRAKRKALRFTQKNMAKRLNLSSKFYGDLERGLCLPRITTFARMISELGVSADAVLGTSSAAAFLDERSEIGRIVQLLRKARTSTLRLVSFIVTELECQDPDRAHCAHIVPESELIELTRGLDSHPEGWEFPCDCAECALQRAADGGAE